MKTIYKCALNLNMLGRTQFVNLPLNSKILSFGKQDDGYFLWALVNPSRPMAMRPVLLIGTGHEVPEKCPSWETREGVIGHGDVRPEWEFVQTIQDGPFIWHLFV